MKPLIFAYFDSEDMRPISDFMRHWGDNFEHFVVFGPADALAIVQQLFPQHVEAYANIRIPSARSDIARLALLYKYGGLYIDCHFSCPDVSQMSEFIANAEQFDCVLIDNKLWRDRRSEDCLLLINSSLFLQPGSKLAFDACHKALKNLEAKLEREKQYGFEPYNIWELSGPGVLNELFFNEPLDGKKNTPKDSYSANALIVREEDFPATRGAFRAYYNDANIHWSERQKADLLFLTDEEAAQLTR